MASTNNDTKRYTNDGWLVSGANPRSVSKKNWGELLTIMESAPVSVMLFGTRFIGPPTEILQAIHHDNPQDSPILYQVIPKTLGRNYPEMPPQNYLSDEAKMAVAEYILDWGI